MELGRLEKIDLRKQWKKEDTEFTPWLAREENIELLSEIIDINLEVQSQEENVGPFRADILCVDTATGNYVLIENQLEKTDHTHLGQLMTYAAGLDAVSIVWIAKKFTEEHRAALDWLNGITNDTFNFFGIEIELFKIGDSKPAPLFKLIAKPNDWTRSVRKSALSHSLTDTQLLQLEYWQAFKEYLKDKRSKIRTPKPLPQNYMNIAIGKSDFTLAAGTSARDNTLSVGLWLMGNNAKENFDALKNSSIDKSFEVIDKDIQWTRRDDKKQSVVLLTQTGDMTNKNQWNEQFLWLENYIMKFDKLFRPLLKKV
jgi:hypothetical protein